MASKRVVAALVIVPLISLVSVAEATLVPSEEFANPLFWIGFMIFFMVGAFVTMNVRLSAKVGGTTFFAIMTGLLVASRECPEAISVASGFPGVFVGMGVMGSYKLFWQTRWAYCPTCMKKNWAVRKNGKLYCMKQGHPI